MGAGAVAFWDGVLADEDATLTAGSLDSITTSRSLTVDDATIVGYTGRDYATNPWELVSFDDIRLPGLCEVKGLVKCSVKNKKAPGSKGNKPTVLGLAPTEFDIICTYWTPNHLDLILDEIDRLWNIPMANPRYLRGNTKKIDPAQFTHSIDHPKLRMFQIFYCVINQVGLPHDGKVPGTQVIEIKCTENRDPGKKDVTATPKPAPVKRHHNFDGPPVQNSSQVLPPSQNPANLGLNGPPTPPNGGSS